MKVSKIILALFITKLFFLFVPQKIFSQTEALDGVRFTPPKGWAKTVKEGATVYTDIDKAGNTFCILTVYAATPSTGDPKRDFATKWKESVVTPFKAEAGPKTETQTAVDGWTATAGGSLIDMNGLKTAVILTVFSGFGRTASVLAIFNDESYSARMQAVVDSLRVDKGTVLSNPPPAAQTDPFPDKPGYQPQKPLAGPLKDSITIADIVGTWDEGGASVTTYVDSSSGNYSGTDTTFYAQSYAIKPDGTFDHKFQGRTANHTVRESSNGTITLSGGYIIVKFTGGERKTSSKYQFVSFMTLPNGGAVLSLIPLGENEKLYDANWMVLECGHGSGYIHCVGGEEWTLRATKPAK